MGKTTRKRIDNNGKLDDVDLGLFDRSPNSYLMKSVAWKRDISDDDDVDLGFSVKALTPIYIHFQLKVSYMLYFSVSSTNFNTLLNLFLYFI